MKYVLVIFLLLTSLGFSKDYPYEVKGIPYEGWVIDKGPKAPLIFLIHDWDGLTQYEKKRSEMLASLGYSVFAIDLFGKGIRPTEDKDKKQHTGELYNDRNKMRSILNSALKAAKTLRLNVQQAVVLGYCFGGAAVLEWARSGADLKAFVTFHGGLQTPLGQNYKNTQGRLLIFHGTADSAITMQDFATLATELETQKIKHEMVTYGGAPHAFTVFDSPRYQKFADEHSWSYFKGFLKEVFSQTR